MFIRTFSLAAAVAAFTPSLADAQIRAGTDAPEFSIDVALNGAPEQFSDFAGKLVYLDFFATW